LQICNSLDSLAAQFREEYPNVEELSTRQKALALVRWLRANNLTGMEAPDTNYRNLRNCLMGHALSEEGHTSLPIVSSAIFCCVAERLGMRSACCAFPSHVHASVFAPPGMSLDGAEEEIPGSDLESMYLDPYGSDNEVTLDDLRSRLVEFGWSLGSEAFLKATPVPLIVARLAQNIKSSYSAVELMERGGDNEIEMKRLRAGDPDLNLEAAVYASMWAELLMKQTSSFHWDANLDSFLNKFALNWSEDAWIVEKYLVPLYDSFIASQPQQRLRRGWENVRAIMNMLQNLDNRQPTVNRRYTQEIHSRVLYRIGQVFRHKRYSYIGIINGWAANGATALPTPHYLTTDEAEEEADAADNPHENSQRPSKIYYTCLYVPSERAFLAQCYVC
jgi:F-box protein 21